MIVGVDFSIRSPGMTIRSSQEELKFYAFPRVGGIKEDCLMHLKNTGVNVILLPEEKILPSKSSIAERERSSLVDAIMETSAICEEIKLLQGSCSAEDISLGIEGFSFGSKGNRLAQISGYQYIFRYIVCEKNGLKPENFHVFSPMTVKATAGKGNYKKEEMIAAFVNESDEALRKTAFWKAIAEDPGKFQTKKGVWLKPIDDIVDSWWVLKTTENAVKLNH